MQKFHQLIIDPGGRLASQDAIDRPDVFFLDPYKITANPTDRRQDFNPLDLIDIAQPHAVSVARRMALALFPKSATSDDAYWNNTSRATVAAVMLHVMTEGRFEDRRNLATLRSEILDLDPNGMSSNPAVEGFIARHAEELIQTRDQSPKQWAAITSTLRSGTDFLNVPELATHLSGASEITAAIGAGRQPIRVYACYPEPREPDAMPWLRILIECFS